MFDLEAIEARLTDGEPLVSLTERGYIDDIKTLIAEVRRLDRGLRLIQAGLGNSNAGVLLDLVRRDLAALLAGEKI